MSTQFHRRTLHQHCKRTNKNETSSRARMQTLLRPGSRSKIKAVSSETLQKTFSARMDSSEVLLRILDSLERKKATTKPTKPRGATCRPTWRTRYGKANNFYSPRLDSPSRTFLSLTYNTIKARWKSLRTSGLSNAQKKDLFRPKTQSFLKTRVCLTCFHLHLVSKSRLLSNEPARKKDCFRRSRNMEKRTSTQSIALQRPRRQLN